MTALPEAGKVNVSLAKSKGSLPGGLWLSQLCCWLSGDSD